MPCTDFYSPTGEILQGAALLDVYGQMWSVVVLVRCRPVVLPLPELEEAYCAATNANDIKTVMLLHVYGALQVVHSLLFHTHRFLQDEPFIRAA